MPLFEDQTPDTIRTRILERVGTTLQTREGSFIYDVISPAAYEIWRIMMTLDEFITAFYVDEFSGKYLDMHAELLGLARRQGTQASAEIRFTGKDGVTIPAGTAFFTTAGLRFDLAEGVALVDGTGDGVLRAADVGDVYNIAAGEITQITRNITGLTSYVNDAAAGGTDPESDEALFSRIDYRRKHPSTSGNENHYKEWALSCDGIGGAKVTRIWNGPGTVRVIVAGYDWEPVDDDVVSSCRDFIETQRPIGAEVTVISAESIGIDVTATLTLSADAVLADVQTEFVSELGTYLKNLAEAYFADSEVYEYTVHVNRIAALLMNIPGVVDYTNLQVNGGSANVVVSGTSVPVLGGVDLT